MFRIHLARSFALPLVLVSTLTSDHGLASFSGFDDSKAVICQGLFRSILREGRTGYLSVEENAEDSVRQFQNFSSELLGISTAEPNLLELNTTSEHATPVQLQQIAGRIEGYSRSWQKQAGADSDQKMFGLVVRGRELVSFLSNLAEMIVVPVAKAKAMTPVMRLSLMTITLGAAASSVGVDHLLDNSPWPSLVFLAVSAGTLTYLGLDPTEWGRARALRDQQKFKDFVGRAARLEPGQWAFHSRNDQLTKEWMEMLLPSGGSAGQRVETESRFGPSSLEIGADINMRIGGLARMLRRRQRPLEQRPLYDPVNVATDLLAFCDHEGVPYLVVGTRVLAEL